MTARSRLIVNLTTRARVTGREEVDARWIEEEVQAPYFAELTDEWLGGVECWTGRQIRRMLREINKDLREDRGYYRAPDPLQAFHTLSCISTRCLCR